MAEIVECTSRQFQQVENIYAELYGMCHLLYDDMMLLTNQIL